MKTRFGVFSALMLAACATSEGYQTKMNDWLGVREDILVGKMGAPSSQYNLPSGAKVLSYDEMQQFTTSKTIYVPGTNGSSGSYQPAGQQLHQMQCKTNFTVARGVVTNVSFSGERLRRVGRSGVSQSALKSAPVTMCFLASCCSESEALDA